MLLTQPPTAIREAIVDLMREHYEDPAGFHEALAGALRIDEHEYEPKEYTLVLREEVLAKLDEAVSRAEVGWMSAGGRAPNDAELFAYMLAALQAIAGVDREEVT